MNAIEQDLPCPRCRYNLRGLTEPRCPECGFSFSFAEARTGWLRDNVPSALDRCDPWQPHQLLLASLRDLVRGVGRPSRYLMHADVTASTGRALLMCICGLMWVWLATGMILAVAAATCTGASPAAALRAGLFPFAPLVLYYPALGATCVLPAVSLRVLGPAPAATQRLRLTLRGLPILTAWGALPAASSYLFLAPAVARVQTMECALLAALPVVALARGPKPRVPARTVLRWAVLAGLAAGTGLLYGYQIHEFSGVNIPEPPW